MEYCLCRTAKKKPRQDVEGALDCVADFLVYGDQCGCGDSSGIFCVDCIKAISCDTSARIACVAIEFITDAALIAKNAMKMKTLNTEDC